MMRLKIRASNLLEMAVLNWSDDASKRFGIKKKDVPKILDALKKGQWSINLND